MHGSENQFSTDTHGGPGRELTPGVDTANVSLRKLTFSCCLQQQTHIK